MEIRGVGFELASGKDLVLRVSDLLSAHSVLGVVVVVGSIAGLDGIFFLWEDVVFVDDVVASEFGIGGGFYALASGRAALRVINPYHD